MEELREGSMEHMLREIFERDSRYEVEIRLDGDAYVATLLFREGSTTTVLDSHRNCDSMCQTIAEIHHYAIHH